MLRVPPPSPQLLSAVPGAQRRAPEGHSHGRETLLGRRPSAAKTAVLQVGLCVGRGTGGGSAAAAAGRCPAAGGGRPLEGSTEQPGRPHAPPPPGGGDRGGAACPRVSPRSPPRLCGPAAGLLPPSPTPPWQLEPFPLAARRGGCAMAEPQDGSRAPWCTSPRCHRSAAPSASFPCAPAFPGALFLSEVLKEVSRSYPHAHPSVLSTAVPGMELLSVCP